MMSFIIISLTFLQFLINVNCNSSPRIVIVGAGPAGIAAASRLAENNFTNIKILEAEGRIGGRIHSVEFGEAVVDLGAEWCHGEENNVVYQLVKDLDLLEKDYFSQNYYHSSRELIDKDFINELQNILNKSFCGLNEYNGEISIGDYLTERYNKSTADYYGNNLEKLKFASEFLDTIAHDILLGESAFSWYSTSAKSDWEECEGNQFMHWKGRGYKTILDILMKTYPDPNKKLLSNDQIILNKEVTKIQWDQNNENGVLIECSDNSKYDADHVVFTPSLGVLKDRYKTLFHPELPQEKIDAIKELGIGAVIKVFLHFPQKWWTQSGDYITNRYFIWGENDRQQILNTISSISDEDNQIWLLDLVGIYTVARNPNLLEAWFSGASVPSIETFSDERIINGITFTLDKYLGNEFKNITKPDSILRFNWYSNPHFRGTYSYQTVQSRKREVSGEITLSKPLRASNGKQVLLFAGEATNPIHYATVHGAVETGFREADRIINLYK